MVLRDSRSRRMTGYGVPSGCCEDGLGVDARLVLPRDARSGARISDIGPLMPPSVLTHGDAAEHGRDRCRIRGRPMRLGCCVGRSTDTTRLEGITAMAKVISTLFISADGVAEIDPDWHFPYFDESMGRAVGEDYDTSDVLLIGRETYDSFAGAWPDREAAGGEDAPFAKQLGDVRKVVVSRQPHEFSWRNSELIKGDLVEAVTELKADAGVVGILIPGSISVVQQLLAAGLVDELRLLVHPVAARKGRRLFDEGDAPYHLKMMATEAFPTGVIRVIYAPTEAPAKAGYDTVKDKVPEGK
jgi:dihydrofolate reductase